MSNKITEQAESIVRTEVHCSLTYIIDSLAKSYGDRTSNADLSELVEQAFEIMCPMIEELEDGSEYEREIFEAWSVSSWLASKLEERGERVVRDFGGHNVWGRATTGQSISMDRVIEEIAQDVLNRK